MKYDLVQLIKDRCELLKDNPTASKILYSLLKNNYSSNIENIYDYGIKLSDYNNTFITVHDNNIEINKSCEETLVGENIKLTLSKEDIFVISYYNYFKTDYKHIIQSFRISFKNGKYCLVNITEYIYNNDVSEISKYLHDSLANSHYIDISLYEHIQESLIKKLYEEKRILPDNYKAIFIDTITNNVTLDINRASSYQRYDDMFSLINDFNKLDISQALDGRKDNITNTLTKVNDVLEKDNAYERRYILLNNRK